MAKESPDYLSYLLRLWRVDGEAGAWRASLESPFLTRPNVSAAWTSYLTAYDAALQMCVGRKKMTEKVIVLNLSCEESVSKGGERHRSIGRTQP